MNLWIRSQDGTTLLKANKLVIEEDSYACNSYYFIKNYTGDIGTKIGKYKSLPRALKVLDEIQDVLMPKINVLQSVNAENNIDDLAFRPIIQCGKVELLQYSDYVYEMPRD